LTELELSMQFTSVQNFLVYVQEELAANRMVLPILPDIALRVRQAVTDDKVSAAELAELIITDMSLATRLIQVANSPLYRGINPINNIQTAVARLGSKIVGTLITSLALQQIFTPSNKFLAEHFRKVWEQSISVSALSRALASLTPHLDADEAMLAGLIHQIGKLPIFIVVEKIPEFRDSPSRMNKLLEKAHPAVGKLIMESWDFPEELKKVAYEYLNFRYNSGSQADYVDLVQVAFLQSVAGTDHPAARVDCTQVLSFGKLGLASDIEVLEIQGVSEDAESARQLWS
jgi:HD-like signal output (HDOD) protein